MSWADRAKTRFPDNRPDGTPKTPITPLLGVLGAPPRRLNENEGQVSGVLGVGGGRLFKSEAANESFPEDHLLAELITASMLACIHHGDSPEAREAMREDCLATPPHLRADLLAHFRSTYPTHQGPRA